MSGYVACTEQPQDDKASYQGNSEGPSYTETLYDLSGAKPKHDDKGFRFDFETRKDTILLYITIKGGNSDALTPHEKNRQTRGRTSRHSTIFRSCAQ